MINPTRPSIVDKPIQVIPNKLYFCSTDSTINKKKRTQYFNIDDMLVYLPFNSDFGPLKISYVYQYINKLVQLFEDPDNKQITFWHLTSTDYKKYTNSIFLICAYQVVILKKTPEQAFQPFQKYNLPPFRDSSSVKCTYQCLIIDCLKGLQRAVQLKWFDIKKFDEVEYAYYDKLENGDINEIIKNKIYGFSTPSIQQTDPLGRKQVSIYKFGTVLKKIGISIVIHLSQAEQFANCLQKDGIKNYFIQFPEFTTPSPLLIQKFIQIVKNSDKNAKIGVNCKTGLGKVGTIISCYAIKQYKFPAPQFIGWIRLCRPGTIVGPQQVFLIEYDKQVNDYNNTNIKSPSSTSKKRQSTPSRSALMRKNSLKNQQNAANRPKYQKDMIKSMNIANILAAKTEGLQQPMSASYPTKKNRVTILDNMNSDSSESLDQNKEFKKAINKFTSQSLQIKQDKQVNTTSQSQKKQKKQEIQTLREKLRQPLPFNI